MLKSFTWIFIALTQCVPHLVLPGGATDPIQMSYPIGTNCFKDVPKTNVTETERMLAEMRETCDYIYEPEERETSCYKLCLLDVSNLIDSKLAKDLNSNLTATGQYYYTLSKFAPHRLMHLHTGGSGTEATDKAYGIISNQLDKCASVGYFHSGQVADDDCLELSPEARAPMDKLVDCFDDVMVGNAKDYQFMTRDS